MAEKLLKLEVVAPDHQALSVEAKSVVVRTPEGEIGFRRTTPPSSQLSSRRSCATKTPQAKRLHLHRWWLRGSQ